MGHAELLGQRLAVRVEVDADDHVGPGEPRTLDDVEADAAQAEHDDVVAGLDLGGVDDRTDAGGDAAADVADLVERGVLADLGQRDLGHHGELGEGRRAHVVAHGLAAERKRLVPSGIRPWPWVVRIAWQRLVFCDRQYSHWRHSGV